MLAPDSAHRVPSPTRRSSQWWPASALLIVILWVIGCGGSQRLDSGTGATSTISSDLSAGTEGFLVQVNPVFLVPSLQDAPPGARPVPGGMVTAFDTTGALVGMSISGTDGFFKIEGASAGTLTLQGRVDPADPNVDAESRLTSLPGMVSKPGAASPVSRQTAVETAIKNIAPTSLAAATQQPLLPGTVVGESRGSRLRVVEGPEYLIYVDASPFERFAHRVAYRFVNAETGAVVAEIEANANPTLNGEPVWASDRELFDLSSYRPSDEELPSPFPPAGIDIVHSPSRDAYVSLDPGGQLSGQSAPLAQTGPSGPSDIFVILVQGDKGSAFEADIETMRKFFRGKGVPDEQVLTVRADKSPDMKAVVKALGNAIAVTNQKILTRRNSGRSSTLIYYQTSHSSAGGLSTGEISLRASSFISPVKGPPEGLPFFELLSSKACRIRFLLDGCQTGEFARQFAQELGFRDPGRTRYPQDIQLFTATDEQNSASSFAGLGGKWTRQLAKQATIVGADLSGIAQPPGPGSSRGTVLAPLADITHFEAAKLEDVLPGFLPRIPGNAPVGSFVPQNPLAIYLPGDPNFCATPVDETLPPPPLEEGTSILKFINETSDRVDLKLELESSVAPISGETEIFRLEPAGTGKNVIEIKSAGPIRNVTILDFNPPQASVPRLETGRDIEPGFQQELLWRDYSGSRTLIIAPPKPLNSGF